MNSATETIPKVQPFRSCALCRSILWLPLLSELAVTNKM